MFIKNKRLDDTTVIFSYFVSPYDCGSLFKNILVKKIQKKGQIDIIRPTGHLMNSPLIKQKELQASEL